MSRLILFIAAIMLTAGGAAAADCVAIATKLSRGACNPLKPMFFEAGAKHGNAADCSTLFSALATATKVAEITPACCADARAFVTAGCACSPEVADMLAGLRVLPAGADAALTLSGIANLMQASSCTTAANGGPMMNACTGSAGCGAAAASA